MRQICATAASQTIVAANREKYALVRDGVPVSFRNDRGERVKQRLRVFDFDRLKREFQQSSKKKTTVQNLRQAVEQRLLQRNPLRTDFQSHYEAIVADYNREKDRVTIEQTFADLIKLVEELDEEGHRAVREGLDEESLAIFDLLKKPDLSGAEIKRIKKVAVGLLQTLKAEKLRVDQWREKEATRDAVQVVIRDFLWSDQTGLPADGYSEEEVAAKSDDIFRHVFRVYPTVPSPYYQTPALQGLSL